MLLVESVPGPKEAGRTQVTASQAGVLHTVYHGTEVPGREPEFTQHPPAALYLEPMMTKYRGKYSVVYMKRPCT